MPDITIGNTTISNPMNLSHMPNKLETYQRAIRGNMIINYPVNTEDQLIDKYRWELPGVVESEMFLIKEEAKKIGNLYLIDYHKIIEVLSGNGTKTEFNTQRQTSITLPIPVITVGGVSKTVTYTIATNPSAGEVFVHSQCSDLFGEFATFYFGDTPADLDNNIVIRYIPRYTVHVLSYNHTFIFNTTATYTLICEEG